MRVVIHTKGHQWSRQAAQAMRHGLAAAGLQVTMSTHDALESCDVVVAWGVNWTNLWASCKARGVPYLVMEAGYLPPRLDWVSLSWNGLKRHGDHGVPESPSSLRWERWRKGMGSWRTDGEVVIVIGQHPGDAAVRHLDWQAWMRAAMRSVLGLDVGPFVFRPHPHVETPDRSLEEDLARARCVVTCNSNVGVDAVYAGVPTIATDPGSMAWDVAAREIARTAVVDQPEPDRETWGRRLASSQWRLDELADGSAWAQVSQRLPVFA